MFQPVVHGNPKAGHHDGHGHDQGKAGKDSPKCDRSLVGSVGETCQCQYGHGCGTTAGCRYGYCRENQRRNTGHERDATDQEECHREVAKEGQVENRRQLREARPRPDRAARAKAWQVSITRRLRCPLLMRERVGVAASHAGTALPSNVTPNPRIKNTIAANASKLTLGFIPGKKPTSQISSKIVQRHRSRQIPEREPGH